MSMAVRLVRWLAAPWFARHPPTRFRLAPEAVGGLLAVVALIAGVGNAAALAAVLAGITHPASLGGWIPALGTLGGSLLGLGGDLCVGIGGWGLARAPRLGAELVVAGLILALLATAALGVAGGSVPLTIGYLVVLACVYVVVTVTAAQAQRRLPASPAAPLDGVDLAPGSRLTPVPWVLPAEPRQPATWQRPEDGAAPLSGRGAARRSEGARRRAPS